MGQVARILPSGARQPRCAGCALCRPLRCHFPEGTLNRDETREELAWLRNCYLVRPELGLWVAIHKSTGHFIGRHGFLPWVIDCIDEVEIAYFIANPWQPQGLGGEAAWALAQYGFETLGLKRMIALIDPVHMASIRTMERAELSF